MKLYTKRWNEPKDPTDGLRILITRYRPRALPRSEETWDLWIKDLAPSAELLAAYQGKNGRTPIPWDVYRAAYLREMHSSPAARERIAELAGKVGQGTAVTLLCSSSCDRESRCHRSLLRDLIKARLERESGPSAARAPDHK